MPWQCLFSALAWIFSEHQLPSSEFSTDDLSLKCSPQHEEMITFDCLETRNDPEIDCSA